jgi:hypothetical protein
MVFQRVGLQLEESLVLLVLLDELEPELMLELSQVGDGKGTVTE